MASSSATIDKKEEKRQRALKEKRRKLLEAHRKRQGRGAFALQELAIVAPENTIPSESAPVLDGVERQQLDAPEYDSSDKQAALKYTFLENITIYARHYKMRVVDGSQTSRWVATRGSRVGGSPYVFRFLRQYVPYLSCTYLYFAYR